MGLLQVNLRVEASLVASLKALAKERGMSLNAAAGLAFEQFLQTPPQQNQAEPSFGHERRIKALEAAVAALQTAMPARSSAATPPPAPPSTAPSKPAPASPPPASGAITTAELAAHLGLKRGTFNERLRRAGGASEGVMVEGWRCVGQARATTGGPLQWLWEMA